MSDYASKIAALLAKAESSTHEEEAKTYREKAQDLMVKWGIDDAMLADKKRQQKKAGEKIVRQDIELRGEYHRGLWYVANGVVVGLGNMRSFIMRHPGNHTTFTVVGYESDVARAAMLIESLNKQAIAAMHEWWKGIRIVYQGDRKGAFTQKRQNIIGFGHGVGDVLKRQREGLVAEAGAELVWVGRDQRVGSWVETNLKTTTKNAQLQNGTMAAHRAGHAAGVRAGENLNQKAEVGA